MWRLGFTNPPPSTLKHGGIVSAFSWPVCVALTQACFATPVQNQTEIQPKPTLHTQSPAFCPSRGVQERWDSAGALGLEWWQERSGASHVQSISHSRRRLCTPLESCFLSLCLGESKHERHFPTFPRDSQSSGQLSKSPGTPRKVWIVEVHLSTWAYWCNKTVRRSAMDVKL